MTPIVIAISLGMDTAIDMLLLFMYLCAVTMRLAYFNVYALKKETNKPLKYYNGLPVSYVSSILPLIILSMNTLFNQNLLILRLTFIILTLLYILKIRIPKPNGKWYYIIPIIALGLMALILLFI